MEGSIMGRTFIVVLLPYTVRNEWFEPSPLAHFSTNPSDVLLSSNGRFALCRLLEFRKVNVKL